MPDSDAGWQMLKEALGKPGAIDVECEVYGTNAHIVHHWEAPLVGDQEDMDNPYPVIDEAFVGDEQKLFKVTSWIDDTHNEVITDILLRMRREDEIEGGLRG